MKIPERRTGTSGPGKRARVPRAARYINTGMAVILCGIGLYHLTQPNEAWRSATAELVSATLLLIAAYGVSNVKATAINLAVAVVATGLGVRHLIHGGGWRSGTVELLMAALLLAAAGIIRRERGKQSPEKEPGENNDSP
jgi:hypothetical protein